MRFRFLIDDREVEIEATRNGNDLSISYGGQTYHARVIHTDDAHFVLEVDEEGPDGFVCRKRIRAAGYRDGERRQLWANGRMINYRIVRQGGVAQADMEAASLAASIPAVVSEILVQVGDRVQPGEKLILLESMKMIIPIQAPREATVTAINCAAGEAVSPGVQLVELDGRDRQQE